jgi:hypothetical protein
MVAFGRTKGWALGLCGRPPAGIFGIEHSLAGEHGAGDGKQPVGDAGQGAAMAVTSKRAASFFGLMAGPGQGIFPDPGREGAGIDGPAAQLVTRSAARSEVWQSVRPLEPVHRAGGARRE